MHPSFAVEREYAVRIRGALTEEQKKALSTGVELEDGIAHFDKIEERGGDAHNRWYHVVLHSGKNRIIRRLMESQDTQVSRLIRTRYGSITLPSWLKTGKHKLLDDSQAQRLSEAATDVLNHQEPRKTSGAHRNISNDNKKQTNSEPRNRSR